MTDRQRVPRCWEMAAQKNVVCWRTSPPLKMNSGPLPSRSSAQKVVINHWRILPSLFAPISSPYPPKLFFDKYQTEVALDGYQRFEKKGVPSWNLPLTLFENLPPLFPSSPRFLTTRKIRAWGVKWIYFSICDVNHKTETSLKLNFKKKKEENDWWYTLSFPQCPVSAGSAFETIG